MQPTSSTLNTNSIRMLNSTTGYFVSGSSTLLAGNLYKTTNAGTNWVPITIPSPYDARNAVDVEFINENTGWIIGGLPLVSGGGIICIKTTNGGTSWTAQPNDIGYDLVSVSIDMADANTGYFIAGTALHIFKTTNGGTNWKKLPSSPGSGTSYNKIRAVSSSLVYVSGGNSLLYKSTDGGTTWNSISIPTPVPTSILFAMDWMDEQNGLIGATSGFLAKTSDGGLSWSTFNTGGSTIRNVCMRNRDSVFAVSDINGAWQGFRYYSPTAAKLSTNLTIGIEGFWNGTTQISDTVNVTLRSQNSPYNIVDQSKAVLSNTGYATLTFNTAPAGNYYIQINHRNSLETWSGAPVYLSANVNNYNFTTGAAQAYGNNMVLKSGRYCDYSGDVNQSGNVDLTDLIQIYNAAAIFTSGYVSEDVNGDDIVDLTDLVITYNNAANFVQMVTP
ncbi:MAG TPA: YCF48-related protein [Ignavibacteria bacterium]|nr:YCF48-related protein [Ignavibacteria bacterium]